MIKMPIKEHANKYSAIVSSFSEAFSEAARIEKKENNDEQISNRAIKEVDSSIILLSAWLPTWKEEITKRQNPSRFAEVFKILSEVFLDILCLFNVVILISIGNEKGGNISRKSSEQTHSGSH